MHQSIPDPLRARNLPAMLAAWVTLIVILIHAMRPGFAPLQGLGAAPLEILLALGAVLWVAVRVSRRDFSWPPLTFAAPAAVWLAVSLIGPLKGTERETVTLLREGVKDIIQFVLYFLVAYTLFVEVLRNQTMRRRAIMALLLATAVAVLLAAQQYATATMAAAEIRGPGMANRHAYGMFLAMALPLLFGVALYSFKAPLRVATVIVVLLGLLTVMAGGPFLAIVLGLLVAAFLRGWLRFCIVAVALLALTVGLLPRLPRANSQVLFDSVLLYKDSDPQRIFRNDISQARADLAGKQRAVARHILDGTPMVYGDLVTELDHSWKWQQRYREWQAAALMIARHPLVGVGAGSYQKNIDRFYGEMPRYPVNLMEPGAQGFYFVWGASAGLPFLLLFMAVLLKAATSAGASMNPDRCCFDQGLGAGILGSLTAVAVASLFTDAFVRGLGVTLALVLALAAATTMPFAVGGKCAKCGPRPERPE